MPALRTRDTQSRPLEVSTDGPQPPTLTIISPTPRTFSFPNSHNLSDSPYSTPSSSPFEPDLRSLALTTSTPPLTRTRTLSPDSISSASPAPSTPKRRKSSTGPFHSSSAGAASSLSPDALERRPKKGDEDYVKRPENAFILFRRKCCEDRLSELDSPSTPSDNLSSPSGVTKKQRQADLSKTISQQWKSLPAEERQYWERLAKEKKKEHEALYPNYVYRPQRVRDKDGKVRNKKRQPKNQSNMAMQNTELLSPISAVTASPATENGDGSTFSFILPPARQHGRSISAPTPPPMHYRSIQIPTMHHIIAPSPSCPSSPNLLSPTAAQNPPMISRRATEGFAYEGYEHLVPPAFLQEGSQLQSSEYLRSMFNISNPSSSSSTSTENTIPSSSSSSVIAPPHIQTTLLPSPNIISPASAISTCSNTSSGPISPSHFLSQPEFNPHVHYYDVQGHLPEYSQFNIDPSTGAPVDFSSMQVDYSKFYASEVNPHVHQYPSQPQPYGIGASVNVVEYPEYEYAEYADYAEVPDFQQPEGYSFSWDSENVWASGTTSTSASADEFDLGSIPPCVVETTPTATPTPSARAHQPQEKPMTPPQPLVARSLEGVEGGLEIEGPGLEMEMEPMEMELDMEGNAIMSMGMGMSMGNGMPFDEMMASGY